MIVQADNLQLGYEGSAIHEAPLSFTIPKVKHVSLTGPNGSGKTTFLKACVGEPVILSGSLSLLEMPQPLSKSQDRVWEGKVAMMPSHPSYPPYRRVTDCFGLLSQSSWSTTAQSILGVLDLHEKNLGQLSAGQRQRFLLAFYLSMGVKLLLLDEPTTYLDRKSKEKLSEILRHPDNPATCTLIATHDIEWAGSMDCWNLKF